MNKIILHCDMNNFYASVETALNPKLKNVPIAVCGMEEDRHGIVLAKNYIAKNYNINAGDTIWNAKKKCKSLVIVSPNFNEYIKYSKSALKIYEKYTDKIEQFGLDECWLDVTNSIKLYGSGVEIANKIRDEIKNKLKITISVGVSFNKIFAKMGSDMKKPDATTVISKRNYKQIIWPLKIDNLIGVGKNTVIILKENGIKTIGDLANSNIDRLSYLIGKGGISLYNYANGIDDRPIESIYKTKENKSISNGITAKKDIIKNEDVWKLIYELSQEVSERLRSGKKRAKGVSISIKNNKFEVKQFQKKLINDEESSYMIAKIAYDLFEKKYIFDSPIRSITVGVMNLVDEEKQNDLKIKNTNEKIEEMEKCIEKINKKFGNGTITSGMLLKN